MFIKIMNYMFKKIKVMNSKRKTVTQKWIYWVSYKTLWSVTIFPLRLKMWKVSIEMFSFVVQVFTKSKKFNNSLCDNYHFEATWLLKLWNASWSDMKFFGFISLTHHVWQLCCWYLKFIVLSALKFDYKLDL